MQSDLREANEACDASAASNILHLAIGTLMSCACALLLGWSHPMTSWIIQLQGGVASLGPTCDFSHEERVYAVVSAYLIPPVGERVKSKQTVCGISCFTI